jgi:hypothetical protein
MISYNIRISALLLLLIGFTATAQNTSNALLDSFYNKQNRPIVILNYTSTDCVNCRIGASSILPKLAGIIGSANMEILIDHKNQQMYLKKFSDIFGQFKVRVSKELSNSLSPDGSSKIYIVGKDQIIPYELKVSSDSIVDNMAANFNRFKAVGFKASATKHQEYIGTDTIFEQSGNIFEASTRYVVLFSGQFQIGKIVDIKKGNDRNFEFTANAIAVKKLDKILNTYAPRQYVSPDSALKMLNMMTLPLVYVENIRMVANKCYVAFKYNSVSIDGGPKNDPDIGIRPRYFIGLFDMNKKGIDIADLSQCQKFFFIDSIHYKNQVYNSGFWACIDVLGDQFAVRSKKEQDKSAHDTTLYISSFNASNGDKSKLETLNHFVHAKSDDQLVLRYDNIGLPVIWNQTTMLFCNSETIIAQKQIHDVGLTYVCDFISINDSMYILGIIDYKQMALLIFDIKSKVISVKAYINDSLIYGDLKFLNKNEFAGYIKDEEKNTFKTTYYTYDWAEPEKP